MKYATIGREYKGKTFSVILGKKESTIKTKDIKIILPSKYVIKKRYYNQLKKIIKLCNELKGGIN